MIQRATIDSNLVEIDRQYTAATSPQMATLLSKLAILDLCGWIEEAMDDVVKGCVTRKLNQQDGNYVTGEVIRKNSSFHYEYHFRKLLAHIIGLHGVEVAESAADQSKLVLLASTLNSLVMIRNSLAHTHIQGATLRLDAPSVTMLRCRDVHDGLTDFENTLIRLGC